MNKKRLNNTIANEIEKNESSTAHWQIHGCLPIGFFKIYKDYKDNIFQHRWEDFCTL